MYGIYKFEVLAIAISSMENMLKGSKEHSTIITLRSNWCTVYLCTRVCAVSKLYSDRNCPIWLEIVIQSKLYESVYDIGIQNI